MADALILDRYRPISLAGSGGYASVAIAWDTRIQRRVAIKTIKLSEDVQNQIAAGVLTDAEIPGLKEARTAALLDDISIVGMYDFEIADGNAYLIMEYIDGLTLSDLIHRYSESLNLDVIAAVFNSVARALKVAHTNQVLHLDIKPDNILINRQGEVKVTDFGLSTLSHSEGFGAARGGTISYMPPEQMQLKNLDMRCDEWALASVLYEMISGTNPFRAANVEEAENAIYGAELVLPSLCKEGLPAQADDVIFRALDPDREERFDTVEDFLIAMKPFLGNPRVGEKQLARIVNEGKNDEQSEEETAEKAKVAVPKFEFPTITWNKNIALRSWLAVNSGLLAALSASGIPACQGVQNPLFWVLIVGMSALTGLLPTIGTIAIWLVFAGALYMQGSIVLATSLGVAALLWVFATGRFGLEQLGISTIPVLLGGFGMGFILPFASGMLLRKKDALITVAFSLIAGLSFASLGHESLFSWEIANHLNMAGAQLNQHAVACLLNPSSWIYSAAALACAAIISISCDSAYKIVRLLGIFLASTCMYGCFVAIEWQASSGTLWQPSLFVSLILLAATVISMYLSLKIQPDIYEEEFIDNPVEQEITA